MTSSTTNITSYSASTIVIAALLVSVALSLGFMGIFYVIRNKRLERRRRRQLQREFQLQHRQHEHASFATAAEAPNNAIVMPAVAKPEYLIDEDISNGREAHRIPAISYLSSDTTPLDFHYVTEHIRKEPNIYVDNTLSTMNCCTCVGDCSDGDCACTQQSQCKQYYDSTGRLSATFKLDMPEIIRECNNACKCNRRACKNMVIQGGCKARLMLFRTKSRGWGVRTLEHLKQGTFIGVYSGELVSVMSSQQREDDTYLFNLSSNPNATSVRANNGGSSDCQQKQEVTTPVTSEAKAGETQKQDEEKPRANATEDSITSERQQVEEGGALVDEQSTVTATSSGQESEVCASEEHELEQQQMEEVTNSNENYQEQKPAYRVAENNFVCDAKFYGNFTRFINHSCDPNVIGIRTFTVHQDDRFPYISFFTNQDVPAGTELTLNYGDSYWLVKCKRDKVFCLCKSNKCKFSKKTLPITLSQYKEKHGQ